MRQQQDTKEEVIKNLISLIDQYFIDHNLSFERKIGYISVLLLQTSWERNMGVEEFEEILAIMKNNYFLAFQEHCKET